MCVFEDAEWRSSLYSIVMLVDVFEVLFSSQFLSVKFLLQIPIPFRQEKTYLVVSTRTHWARWSARAIDQVTPIASILTKRPCPIIPYFTATVFVPAMINGRVPRSLFQRIFELLLSWITVFLSWSERVSSQCIYMFTSGPGRWSDAICPAKW